MNSLFKSRPSNNGKFYKIDVGLKTYFHKSKDTITATDVFNKLDDLNVNYSNQEIQVYDMDLKKLFRKYYKED